MNKKTTNENSVQKDSNDEKKIECVRIPLKREKTAATAEVVTQKRTRMRIAERKKINCVYSIPSRGSTEYINFIHNIYDSVLFLFCLIFCFVVLIWTLSRSRSSTHTRAHARIVLLKYTNHLIWIFVYTSERKTSHFFWRQTTNWTTIVTKITNRVRVFLLFFLCVWLHGCVYEWA